MFDVAKVRADFPILGREVNGKPLVYLDNGASAQKPQVVIDAMTQACSMEYANVHRGLHYLSNLATEKYEAVRGIVARFLNAPREGASVFTTGTGSPLWARFLSAARSTGRFGSVLMNVFVPELQIR